MKQENNAIIVGECEIHPSAQLCPGAVIGKPFRKFLDGTQEQPTSTGITEDTYIGYYAIIGSGSVIGFRTIVDDHCIIESRVVIGTQNLVTYRAQVCNDVTIGDGCIIGGFIGERTIIGNSCRIFGKIIHSQHDPTLGWDDDEAIEKSATIEDYAFVGFNALVIGGVTIGRNAYVCAGSIVTRDVPEYHIASEVNKITPFAEWRGILRESPFFGEHHD